MVKIARTMSNQTTKGFAASKKYSVCAAETIIIGTTLNSAVFVYG
ncbi:hypothetical protein Q8W13_00280 [Photobacterium damselae subsp. piscicida]|nr:hypothetical protein [Photobacterium damselae subsp. piscicida]